MMAVKSVNAATPATRAAASGLATDRKGAMPAGQCLEAPGLPFPLGQQNTDLQATARVTLPWMQPAAGG